jgi:DNA-binding GntR family transcriptional regulator
MSAVEGRRRRPSLVDDAEQAIRNWLAPIRHRPGDRLPPEHDLASMLGVSRGTLRTALERLEQTGEIIRRQGSGTFVGRVPEPAAFSEGLERLESYSSLARARGVTLTQRDLRIEASPLSDDLARVFAAEPGTPATVISRVVLADGEPIAVMVDTVHPDVSLPAETRLRRALERGDMILDILIAESVPIAFANTKIAPRLLKPQQRIAKALDLHRTTAALELEETFHLTSGECVHHSRDIFAPTGLDLRVVRWLDAKVSSVAGTSPPRPRAS